MGVGGIGMNAVQGARIAGARHIVAVDSEPYKRDRTKKFGATHVASSAEDARSRIATLTEGRMADVCVLSVDVATGSHVGQALSLVGKRGRVVLTAISRPTETTVEMPMFDVTFYEKQVRGSLFGSSNPRDDILRLLELYQTGQLKLDELITREYCLEDINQGYDDLLAGRNFRGVLRF